MFLSILLPNGELRLILINAILKIDINQSKRLIYIFEKESDNSYVISGDDYNPMIEQLNKVILKELPYQNNLMTDQINKVILKKLSDQNREN